jgi:hypothetical protein
MTRPTRGENAQEEAALAGSIDETRTMWDESLTAYWTLRAPGAAPIAALPADDSAAVQALMRAFADLLATRGVRVGGVTQARDNDARGRSRIMLRDLRTGADYPISQDLGPGSVACNLDNSELALACGAVEEAARTGADLIFISKFAKQEAARAGLCDAFRAAISAHIPVVAAVSPYFRDEWRAFAGELAVDVSPDINALEAWWSRMRAATRQS